MHIIVVDDDAGSRKSIARFLERMGHAVTECESVAQALVALESGSPQIVLTDIKMPEMSGLELLRRISALTRPTRPKVVLFTGHGSLESAIEALRMGAYDYLLKPVKAEELMAVVDKIASSLGDGKGGGTPTVRRRPAGCDEINMPGGKQIKVSSPIMRQIVTQALKYHEDPSMPVLILGETGTGKELIARLIHHGLDNKNRPFVDINCAAISASLFESELFGYKSGSFTGGKSRDQEGKFDIARGGTIFLDEVAEVPIELQAKLLRVVEEREYYRVGGLHKLSCDARIIAATNADLGKAVIEGRFRRDLYYRLQVGEIFMPPLRERKEDILPIAASFLADMAKQMHKQFAKISKEVEKRLLGYPWPGNIRELKNVIRWAVFMFDDDELKLEHIDKARLVTDKPPREMEALSEQTAYSGSLIDRHVHQLVQAALTEHRGNKAAAARYLGVSRRSLYRLLERAKD